VAVEVRWVRCVLAKMAGNHLQPPAKHFAFGNVTNMHQMKALDSVTYHKPAEMYGADKCFEFIVWDGLSPNRSRRRARASS
jgi:hypothetical protein